MRIVEVVRDFPVRSRLPFVVAVHGDEGAIAAKGAAKTWFFYESFSPRIKGFRGEREVFCESWDEAPMGGTHSSRERAGIAFDPLGHDIDRRRGRDVVARRQVRIGAIEGADVIEKRLDLLEKRETPAHGDAAV